MGAAGRKTRQTSRRVALLTLLVSALFCQSASGQPGYNRWQTAVTPFFWLSYEDSEVFVDDTRMLLGIDPKWAIVGHFEAKKRVWTVIAELYYRNLDLQEDSVSVDLRTIVAEASLGYRMIHLFDRVGFEVIGGVRYFNTRVDIRYGSRSPTAEQNWVDPILGCRASWQVDKHWTLSARGDVGGWKWLTSNPGLDFTLNAAFMVAYRMRNVSFVAGYRALHAEFSETLAVKNAFEYHATTSGFGLGITFHWPSLPPRG